VVFLSAASIRKLLELGFRIDALLSFRVIHRELSIFGWKFVVKNRRFRKMTASPPRAVFLSYHHDSPEHARQVLRFSKRLRDEGVDAEIDQYVGGRPPCSWPRWMPDKSVWADFVIFAYTETYYRSFRAHEQPDIGKGVYWEGELITLETYDARSRKANGGCERENCGLGCSSSLLSCSALVKIKN
jgi:hypothetical protein